MCLSLRRALAVVTRQATMAFAALRWVSQAATARRTVAWSPSRRPRHGVDTTANSISAICSPLPCVGVSWKSHLRKMRPASAGGKVAYHAAGVWVFRWSNTTLIPVAWGKWTSNKSCIP